MESGMPRVTDLPPGLRTTTPEGTTPPVSTGTTTPSTGTTATSAATALADAGDHFESIRSASPVEVYFAPYDNAAKAEIGLLNKVIEARKADTTEYPPGENPYQIHYAVYNLRSPGVIQKMLEAVKLGIDVKVLIEDKQIAPESHWNTVDDVFEEAGLSVLRKDLEYPEAEREAAHLIGIQANSLMHLKSRIFTYKDPETGALQKSVLSGSMNPGDGANLNDENLNLIEDNDVIALYEKKFDDVMRHKRTDNVWSDDRGLNVLFTPAKSGPRPIEKMFEWMDQEQDLIVLTVFDLNNIKEPGSKKTLVEKLQAAKERGVEVIVVTDRKKSDGLDQHGNRVEMYGHFASNDWTDEDLEKLGIPVYEFVNENGDFNAMHPKAAIFGLENMKVLTGAGNWTRNSMGSGNKRGRNEESFIFVDSGKLDENRSGMRYLSNFLYLLRTYDHQNTEHEPAEALIKRLQAKAHWPQVPFAPKSLLPPDFEGEAFLVGEHPALEGRPGEPGLRVNTSGGVLGAMSHELTELPFGTELKYDVVTKRPDGSYKTLVDDTTLVLVPKGLAPRMPRGVKLAPPPSSTSSTGTASPNNTPAGPQPADTPIVSNAPAAVTTTTLGLLASSQSELVVQHNQLHQEIGEAVQTFPQEAQGGVRAALHKSTSRILEAHKAGRVQLEEAAQALEMLREMVEALIDLRTGNAEIIQHDQHGEHVEVWKVKAPDGDEFSVSSRLLQDEKGEARVSIRHNADDGEALKGRFRMSLRMDLERWGTASVDVQFGESAMDKRIHGLYKNEDGSIFKTPSGKQLADHHFREGIDESLKHPDAFADMIRAFVSKNMEPLPVTP